MSFAARARAAVDALAISIVTDRKADEQELRDARRHLLRAADAPDLSRLSNGDLTILEALQDKAAGRPPRDLAELRDSVLEMAAAIGAHAAEQAIDPVQVAIVADVAVVPADAHDDVAEPATD